MLDENQIIQKNSGDIREMCNENKHSDVVKSNFNNIVSEDSCISDNKSNRIVSVYNETELNQTETHLNLDADYTQIGKVVCFNNVDDKVISKNTNSEMKIQREFFIKPDSFITSIRTNIESLNDYCFSQLESLNESIIQFNYLNANMNLTKNLVNYENVFKLNFQSMNSEKDVLLLTNYLEKQLDSINENIISFSYNNTLLKKRRKYPE